MVNMKLVLLKKPDFEPNICIQKTVSELHKVNIVLPLTPASPPILLGDFRVSIIR